jgi:crotonobetainyl-CoA:carnitine CoA-transferase CaiB-like acyl-CoA transferase
MPPPLEGLRVVDLTENLAGPFCTMILADMGADVVKIERPGGGDESRRFPPFVKGESAGYLTLHRGKRSVVLDLKDPGGRDALLRLVARADVLVEAFPARSRSPRGCRSRSPSSGSTTPRRSS